MKKRFGEKNTRVRLVGFVLCVCSIARIVVVNRVVGDMSVGVRCLVVSVSVVM
jgi:hypothetical protein